MKKKITLAILFIAICFIIIIPSIILLGASSWSLDEYGQAAFYRNGGLVSLWQRLLGWSPRSLSDSILYIYYRIVNHIKMPFAEIFLGILWVLFGSSIYIGLRNIIKNNTDYLDPDKNYKYTRNTKSFRFYLEIIIPVLLSLFLFIYFLFIAKPTEIFYWPAAAAAYLLSASGIILGLCTLIKVSNSSHVSYAEAFSLVVLAIITAFSSEVGALYQLLASICLLTILILFRIKYSPLNLSALTWDKLSNIKLFGASLTSFVLSSTVLFLLKNSRVGTPELNSLSSPITGNIKSSVILAIKQTLKETFLLNNTSFKVDSFFASFSYSLVCKLALLLLVILFFIQAKVSLRKSAELTCVILILPLIVTNFVMITASYYQFGEICCDRHLHFRAILTGLSLFILGLVIASRLHSYLYLTVADSSISPKKSSLKSFLLTSNFSLITVTVLSLILFCTLQISAIESDIKNFQLISNPNKKNWLYNISSQSSSGKYINPHTTKYVRSLRFRPEIYLSHDNLNSHLKIYMNYFNKKKLFVYPNDSVNPKK